MRKTSVKQKISLVLFGVFLCVVLLEVGLRIGGFIFLSLQEYRNMVSLKQRGEYRIICLGESTTAYGGKNSYPHQLEEILNQRDIRIKFSVINKGVPGINSAGILSRLEDNLNKYDPDMVITMIGINDGIGAISYEDSQVVDGDTQDVKTRLFFRKFRTYKLAKLLWLHIVNKIGKMEIGMSKEKKKDIDVQREALVKLNNHHNYYTDKENMYKKVIEINPRNDAVYTNLGRFYKEQARYEEAEAMFKKALEINSRSSDAYAGLGCCYRAEERYKEAEVMFKKAIEINPWDGVAYVGLGRCRREQGKPKEVKELCKKAIEINPWFEEAYVELGKCYRNEGRYKEAEEIFKKAIEINPFECLPYLELEGCYKEQRKYGKNVKMYKRFVYNYRKLKEIVLQRGIKLVCVQYPVHSVKPLKKLFESTEGLIFVDNERVFKDVLKHAKYEDYFTDNIDGDFGHCSHKGNRLLAENIANVILRECFDK